MTYTLSELRAMGFKIDKPSRVMVFSSWAGGDVAVAIMRSEINDLLICGLCRDSLDGITRPAGDPCWAGELGGPAHNDCRFDLVVLTAGTPAVLDMLRTVELPGVVAHMRTLMTNEQFDFMREPARGVNRLRANALTIEDIEDAYGPYDLVARIFGYVEE